MKHQFDPVAEIFKRDANQGSSIHKDGWNMERKDDSLWFVAQLRPQGLARAQEHLQQQGIESFSPQLHFTTGSTGLLRKTYRPLFPGYIFVSFDPEKPGWTAINNTRGVSRLILDNPRWPHPLPMSLMAGLRARFDADGLCNAQDDLDVGDRIRVLAGPFADLVATIEEVPGPERIGILIDLMGRKVKTTLPRSQVQKQD